MARCEEKPYNMRVLDLSGVWFSDLGDSTGIIGLSAIVRCCCSLNVSNMCSSRERQLHDWEVGDHPCGLDRRDRVDVRRHRIPIC